MTTIAEIEELTNRISKNKYLKKKRQNKWNIDKHGDGEPEKSVYSKVGDGKIENECVATETVRGQWCCRMENTIRYMPNEDDT